MRRKEGQEGGKAGTGGGWRIAAGLRLVVLMKYTSVSYYPRKEGRTSKREGRGYKRDGRQEGVVGEESRKKKPEGKDHPV
jgi:hypothetical protein